MSTLFVSDLHLSNERPSQLELFRHFMAGPARRAEALYILGDLVEVWAGDDDKTAPHPWLIATLRAYTNGGGRLYVMRGNRDFLMGERFCRETGAILLPDPSVITLRGQKALLMHGDLLCTDDTGYQRYRRLVHTPRFQQCFLAIPGFIRTGLAHGFRWLTQRLSRRKTAAVTDVSPLAVTEALRTYGIRLLIHGHTHRPGIHEFTLDGQPARRIVIGDWYEQDSVLVSDEQGGERLLRIRDML